MCGLVSSLSLSLSEAVLLPSYGSEPDSVSCAATQWLGGLVFLVVFA